MSTGAGYSRSKTGARDLVPEEYQSLRGPLADVLSGSFGDISSFLGGDLNFGGVSNLDAYRSPMTSGENLALDRLGTLSEGGGNDLAASNLIGSTLRGDYLTPDANPYLRDLIGYSNKAINDTFNSEDLAQRALFSRAGHTLNESSPFAQVSADLAKSRLDAIGRNTAEIGSRAYEGERSRQVQAVEQQRANAGFEFQRQLETLQAKALPRLIDEIGYDRGFQEFSARLNALAAALGLAVQTTQPTPVSMSRSYSQNTQIS